MGLFDEVDKQAKAAGVGTALGLAAGRAISNKLRGDDRGHQHGASQEMPAEQAVFDESNAASAPQWELLKKYDADIAEAARQVAPYGRGAEHQLAYAVLTLNNKEYLPAIVAKTMTEAVVRNAEREREMNAAAEAQRKRANQEQFESAERGKVYIVLLGFIVVLIAVIWIAKSFL